MAPTIYIIDPDPDTVIMLTNPCTIFAPWKPERGHQPNDVDGWGSFNSMIPKKKKKAKVKKAPPPPPSPPPEPLSAETPEDSSMFALDDGSTAPAETSSAMQYTPPPIAPEEPGEPEEHSIHYHVSSRHLMLASSTFKRMLAQDGFAESVRNEADGFYHIAASDWDPEAFLMVLQIVHGRNKQVPREITLEMLAKIAVLEDYYNFGEALDVFIEVWVRSFPVACLPPAYCRDLVLWIWVAWVFDIEQHFTRTTAIAIEQSTESLQTMGLPILTVVSGTYAFGPQQMNKLLQIVDEIDSKRYQTIESLIEELHQSLEMYRRADYDCPYDSSWSFQCGSFLLGNMMREMSRIGLYKPRPKVPFLDLSFAGLCEQVQGMQSASLLQGPYAAHQCNLRAVTATLIAGLSSRVGGLSLADLKDR